jgi:hypothetical protein
LSAVLTLAGGCGTTRVSSTARTATEQLLISNAVDQVVSTMDFTPLAGKKVFFDCQFLDGTVDKGYVASSIRQSLLAGGCLLQEDRAKATYVVEARSGAVGTDSYSLLVGIPAMNVPTFVPGQPSQIPEIPFAKKNDEQGAAKLAVFAYNRETGQRVWQSGTVEALSSARDMWVVGLGPFRKGSILHGTEFAGEELPNPLHRDGNESSPAPPRAVAPTNEAAWAEPPPKPVDWSPVVRVLASATLGGWMPSNSTNAPAVAQTKQGISTSDGQNPPANSVAVVHPTLPPPPGPPPEVATPMGPNRRRPSDSTAEGVSGPTGAS